MSSAFRHRSAALAIAVSVFAACAMESSEDPGLNGSGWESEVQISNPRPQWRYFSDLPVFLSSNLDSDAMDWFSSLEGSLGSGNGLSRYLAPGRHEIRMQFGRGFYRSVTIDVLERRSSGPSEGLHLIASASHEIYLPEGRHFLGAYALEGSARGLSIGTEILPLQTLAERELRPLRDFRVATSGTDARNFPKALSRESGSRTLGSIHLMGDLKTFFVVNTAMQLAQPHEVVASLVRIGAHCTVWVAMNYGSFPDAIDSCVAAFEDVIHPRVSKIWGSWEDVDGDGKIALLSVRPSTKKVSRSASSTRMTFGRGKTTRVRRTIIPGATRWTSFTLPFPKPARPDGILRPS